MTRTKNEIEAALKNARLAYDNHNNVMSEGHDNGNNPHHTTIQNLIAELYTVTQSEIAAKLSGDSLQSERIWFNGQGFNRPDLAQKACQARGYNMSDLFAAIKASK